MAAKRSLADALKSQQPARPIQRGEGFKLSTHTQDEGEQGEVRQEGTSAQEHNGTKAPQVLRPSKGQRIRTDLLREVKRIAFEDERKDYEVLEDALEQYVARWKESRQS